MTQPEPTAVRALLDEDLAELFEHAPAGYVSTFPDGTIVRVNQTFRDWTGFAPEELTGRRLQDLFSMPGRIYYETHLGPLLAMQGSLSEVAVDIARRDGTLLPALVNALQKRGADGKPLLHRFTVFNATERRRYERQLLEARREAERALRAKAELLAMLSHDVRTPLTAILAVASLLEGSQSEQDKREAVRILRSSASSAVRLVESVLEHSQLEAGVFVVHAAPFGLRALVEELVASLAPLASGKNIALRHEVDAGVPERLLGDATKLGQVLGNLLGNALKFTESGTVALAIERLAERRDEVDVRMRVTDTGIGIPARALPTIFEEYSRGDEATARRYGGSGLGLAISRRLVQAMGGELQVRSRVGEGSEFWFELTLAAVPPAE